MATATFTAIADMVEGMGNKEHDFDADTLQLAFSNTPPGSEAPNPTTTGNGILANVTQISYNFWSDDLTVDRVLDSVTWNEASGNTDLDAADFVITASGGTIATYQYMYLFNQSSTTPDDQLIGLWDFGSAISLADTQTHTITIHANGLIRFA